jgi:UTP--glucose-1-phosphate uridylyltransferase
MLLKGNSFRNRRYPNRDRQNKRSIEDHFDKSYELEYTLQKAGKDLRLTEIRKVTDLADICYVRQKEQKGLGDAIYCAKKHIGSEPFAVLLGDSITKGPIPCKSS